MFHLLGIETVSYQEIVSNHVKHLRIQHPILILIINYFVLPIFRRLKEDIVYSVVFPSYFCY